MNSNQFLKIKKIGDYLASIFKNHPTWSLLVLIFLLAIYALIIFGSYAIKNPVATAIDAQLQINNELYQQTLSRLKARDTNIQQGIGQNYPDIFQ